jgi:hypothetical protein
MSYTRFVSTIAALFVVPVMLAGPALAADDPKAPERRKLMGIYGGVGFGAGIFDEPDEVEDAWRLLAWYRPYDFVSLEIGYIDAGDPTGVEDVDGLHLALVPTLPLYDAGIDLFGKIGGFFFEDDELAIGLGAAYHLPYGFGVRFDWDRLNLLDSQSIDVVTLALFYRLDTN